MKFLITGASGQLGQEWEKFLTERGATFTAYSSSRLDITNPRQIKEIMKADQPDIVLNCAAWTDVDGAEREKERAFEVNSKGVSLLAAACRQTGAKLVHYSTDYVFGGDAEDEVAYPDGYPEDAPIDPVNVYGESKAEGEKAIREQMEDYLILRVSWLCGARGKNFVKTMLKLADTRSEVSVVSDQVGSPAFAIDVVMKSMKLLENEQIGTFHCSSEGKISWADFAEAIFTFSGKQTAVKRISTAEYKTDAKRPEFSLLSKQKLKLAGLQPLNWQLGLRALLRELE